MNLDLIREIVHRTRYLLVALLVIALCDAALYGYRTLMQQPELERMQNAFFASRAAGGGGAATQRTAQYQNALNDLSKFQEKLIPKKDFARFLEELFSVAEKHALTLKGISYKPSATKGQPVVTYAMSLSVEGKYPALKSFIAEMSRYPQMVTVDAVSLRNSSITQESVELQLQLTAFLKTEGA